MKVILIRHGEAEPHRTDDAGRALTQHGRHQAQKTGHWLRKSLHHEGGVVCLLASPYRRARETAEVISGQWPLPVGTVEAITPDTDPRVALVAIEQASAGADIVLVVSHMPLVGALAAWLETGTVGAGRGFSLAEARVLEADMLAPGLATTVDDFIPGITDQ
ncbi:MAG TPA: histidine phosphatase family protein [Moraxellaceae bacterium]|nr:histidine phosphatase family protein [Moraxellaceae bacterium]